MTIAKLPSPVVELPTAAVTQMKPVPVDIAQIRSLAVASRAALEQMEGRPGSESGSLSLGGERENYDEE